MREMTSPRLTFWTRLGLGTVSLAVGSAIWLPMLSLLYRSDPTPYFRNNGPVAPKARMLAAYHLKLWTDPALREREISKMRGANAEWDFMGRTFLVLALANMALREPAAQETYLKVADDIIDETLRLEREKGLHFFLMPYARRTPFVVQVLQYSIRPTGLLKPSGSGGRPSRSRQMCGERSKPMSGSALSICTRSGATAR